MWIPKTGDTHVFRARHGMEKDWFVAIFPEGREKTPQTMELPDGPYDIDDEGSEKVRMYIRVHMRAREDLSKE